MVRIETAGVSRKFNLGNYESMEVRADGFLEEGETLAHACSQLNGEIEAYVAKFKQGLPVDPQPAPLDQAKPAAATAKPVAASAGSSSPAAPAPAAQPKPAAATTPTPRPHSNKPPMEQIADLIPADILLEL